MSFVLLCLTNGFWSAANLLLILPGYGVVDLVAQAGLFVKAVLLALLLLSIISWSITLNKYWQYRSFHRDYYRLINLLRPNADLPTIYARAVKNHPGPISRIFEEGQVTLAAAFDRTMASKSRGIDQSSAPPKFTEGLAERTNHTLEQDLTLRLETATDIELSQLEAGLSSLATITTASPFIGLLGTVWGIMNAFIGISQSGNADLSVVAPGIAEALITTVAGLAVAIPAVLCHNFLATRLRKIEDNLIRLATELKIYFVNWWYREKSKIENRAGYQRDFAR
ncbi:MAG: MotA/TolQ/ExbB proton channel family protein [candidate division KSB1 bacterium]|nr:MotA/TolQ/ExbB proton channel family protein [candidate division KSB1 bacterium]MDZ7304504.1 MotA/TolQ/ExbB proton channel family protein [candidate division KSB1 bacterium]MDZ7313884.1 MotA/TolQ/ExbB proton channel family protein [candidate division KSB1 bacterium]